MDALHGAHKFNNPRETVEKVKALPVQSKEKANKPCIQSIDHLQSLISVTMEE